MFKYFWTYFEFWNTWGDGAIGATSNDIQEIVFTRTKITDVQPKWFEQQQLEASFRKPGRAQMSGGGYIEFTVPKSGITPTPYIGGVGNSGRIIVEGRMQLDIRTLNPKYVKRWWPF